jgi:hypothetical protein
MSKVQKIGQNSSLTQHSYIQVSMLHEKMAIHTFNLVSTICDFWPKFHTFWLPPYIGGLWGPPLKEGLECNVCFLA